MFRPLCRNLLTPPLAVKRSYAVSVTPGKLFENRLKPREFKGKKGWQYALYRRILEDGLTSSPVILLQFDQFSAQRLQKLRTDIGAAFARVKPSPPLPIVALPKDSSESTPQKFIEPIAVPKPGITVVRTSIFGAALRDVEALSMESRQSLAQAVDGQLALLTIPTFTNPPQLAAIIRLLDRTLPPRAPPTPEEIAKALAEKNADPVSPGRRVKRQRRVLNPELVVIGGIIEGSVYLQDGVRAMSTMATLENLRMQILGLIAAPGSNLVGALSEASGGSLLRALDGYRRGLEPAEPVVGEAES